MISIENVFRPRIHIFVLKSVLIKIPLENWTYPPKFHSISGWRFAYLPKFDLIRGDNLVDPPIII